jgi:phosphoribosylformylglycinamidine synthase
VRAAVIVFPGSNCDQDAAAAWRLVTGGGAELVWHERADLGGAEAVILPGGFAHGDYLRCGALCRFSPVMAAVAEAAAAGVPVLGICNGFQVLCEAGLLPGALGRNAGLDFRCETVGVRVEASDAAWTAGCTAGSVLRLPVAHGEGRYWLPPEEHRALEARRGVVLRYVPEENPNGSLADIAGVCSAGRNVVGLMPHPERAVEALLGGEDGRRLLASALSWTGARPR